MLVLRLLPLLLIGLLPACAPAPSSPAEAPAASPSFTLLSPEQTGVDFVNRVPEDPFRNILRYQYYYNGGGVAIGDVNNDGLPDLVFSSNTAAPQLYLNQGELRFRKAVGAGLDLPGPTSWNTGISLVDINGDGALDLYLCRSGNLQEDNRRNLLFLNRGDGVFTESAARFGLDDPGYSIQAAFFDYDRDGDLDLYLANHGINFYGREPQGGSANQRDRFSGDKLYRNDGDRFSDVTARSGILERAFSYGLGVGIADLDQNGWDDIYVSNDFFEHDYLYLNQGNGAFRESIKATTRQISYFGMGNDLADINDDGLIDILVVDMMPADHIRRQTNLAGLNYEEFREFIDRGYHHQYMFNSLNVNNGPSPGGEGVSFSNYAQYAGIAQTDWSWAPLIADLDNDGAKDIYITNGLRKDVLNLDFINNTSARYARLAGAGGQLSREQFMALLAEMPSEKTPNAAFRNRGELSFENVAGAWGLDRPSFSNGAAYGDLDGDGDLDLVVNNLDEAPFIYRNDLPKSASNHFLRIRLKGSGKNTAGLGARVRLITDKGRQLFQQAYWTRGYQSSVEPVLHFGLGDSRSVQVEVIWSDGRISSLAKVEADQTIVVEQASAASPPAADPEEKKQFLFADISSGSSFTHLHRENPFDDFKREFLLPHRLSTPGPIIAVADINKDGREDFFIGAAAGAAAVLYRSNPSGAWKPDNGPWELHQASEDSGALFFDADGDGDADLYAGSGSNEFPEGDARYRDRLYLNDGAGNFTDGGERLPDIRISTSCVKAADVDADGDLDLFVGGRLVPGRYPMPASSFLLRNEGGRFSDATKDWLPELANIGMLTDALWTDFDGDGRPDLVLTGEWMTLRFFRNEGSRLREVTGNTGLPDLTGWYFTLAEGDFDGDGDPDFLAGNLGLNHRYQASAEQAFEVVAADFDDNGSIDPILCYEQGGRPYPLHGRHVLQDQLNFLKRRYTYFADYARATINEILGPEAMAKALRYRATNFASVYLENLGGGKFSFRKLPPSAQAAPVRSFLVDDFDGDGNKDVLLAGNLYGMEHRTPRSDAGHGLFLKGNGRGNFVVVPARESGFYVPGDVRTLGVLSQEGQKLIIAGKNNDRIQLLRLLPSSGSPLVE